MSSTSLHREAPHYFLATSITHFSGDRNSDPFSTDYANETIKTLEECKTSHVFRDSSLNFHHPNTIKKEDRQFVSMTYSNLRSLPRIPTGIDSEEINREKIDFSNMKTGKIFFNSLWVHDGLIPENMNQALRDESSFSSNYIDSMMLYGRRAREQWAEPPPPPPHEPRIIGGIDNFFLLGNNLAYTFPNKHSLSLGRSGGDGPFGPMEYNQALNPEDPLLQVCSTENEVFMAIYPYLHQYTPPSRDSVVKVTLTPKFNPAVTKVFDDLRVTLVPVSEQSGTKSKFHILHRSEEVPDGKETYRIAATTLIVDKMQMPALLEELDIYFKTAPPKTKRSIINTEAVLRTLRNTRHITVLSAVSNNHLETMQQQQTTAGAAAAAVGGGQSASSAEKRTATEDIQQLREANQQQEQFIEYQEDLIEQLETNLQDARNTNRLADQQQGQRIKELKTDLQDVRRTNRLARHALTALIALNTAALTALYYSATQEENSSSWF